MQGLSRVTAREAKHFTRGEDFTMLDYPRAAYLWVGVELLWAQSYKAAYIEQE